MQEDLAATLDRDRLRFIIDFQQHLDRYLAPIADPKGKSVLLIGAGAGTEILWCLERGAASVTAIDIKPQPTTALEKALSERSVNGSYRVLEMGIEDADALGETFDLLISNNVFEHLPDVSAALAACGRLARPGSGRIAIFSSPLFYGSSGSHLEHEPWEHLWADPEALREKLLCSGELPEYHALNWTDLKGYFHAIGLNRMTFDTFLDAVRSAGLVILEMGIVKDRNLERLGEYLPRLKPICNELGISVSDLTLEGFWVELATPEGADSDAYQPLLETRGVDRATHPIFEELERSQARVYELEPRVHRLEPRIRELENLLARVEKSPSYRLGRLLTAPLRRVRALL